jgi:hypothetical protein
MSPSSQLHSSPPDGKRVRPICWILLRSLCLWTRLLFFCCCCCFADVIDDYTWEHTHRHSATSSVSSYSSGKHNSIVSTTRAQLLFLWFVAVTSRSMFVMLVYLCSKVWRVLRKVFRCLSILRMISNWMGPDKGRAGSDAVRHYANYTSRHVPSIDTVVKQQDQTVTAGPHELRRCGLASHSQSQKYVPSFQTAYSGCYSGTSSEVTEKKKPRYKRQTDTVVVMFSVSLSLSLSGE